MKIPKLILAFIFLACMISCDKEQEPTSSSQYYFSAIIDGEELLHEHSALTVFGGGESSQNGDNSCRLGYTIGLGKISNPDGESVSITFDNLLIYNEACDTDQIAEDFVPAFETGEYNFQDINFSSLAPKEMIIYYQDDSGSLWRSNDGPQSSSSNFEVLEAGETTSNRYIADQIVEVKCRFNCTVYDGNGGSLEITDAEAVYLYFND